MKYILVVPDGVADKPIPELGNKTPLEAAKRQNLDTIVQKGLLGQVQTVPKELPSGSDVACMSLLGYDPRRYYTGRAPLEAASLGISLSKEEVVFRCNLITLEKGKMKDYSAGHISSEEAKAIIATLQEKLGGDGFQFYAGVQYRHLLVSRRYGKVKCTPPHDIAGKEVEPYFPKGEGEKELRELMEESQKILSDHPVNQKRKKEGKDPATSIWLWGQGTRPVLPSFNSQYGLDGSVISAVDLVRGVGRSVGLEVIQVPGATGYFDTDYKAKAQYGLEALKKKDFLFIHVESTDEAGHMGDVKLKVEAIEDFDNLLVGTLLEGLLKMKEFRLLLLPDHMTSTVIRTHTHDPVPFTLFGTGVKGNGFKTYTEEEASHSKLWVSEGFTLMGKFLKGEFS
ncbi:MAG: cofactor-independent phosphoglycerate mutase [Candidatus Omnitrophica bacterium]|nr:cofactor-independent phosphoglycerate mutase [Candidatus Omnitrophota bacterium]